jgi:hypothetical protein
VLICLNAGQPALLPQCRVYGEGVVHEEVRIFVMLAGASLPSVTHAQVSIDMARVTCAKRNAKVVGNYCKTPKSDTVMNAMQKNWR